jgi:hypothetical protein
MARIDPSVIARGRALAEPYREAVEGIEIAELGVLHSEAFFVRAVIGDDVPERIVESGRARGMSTLLLSICFPDSEIVSIEFDGDSPNEAFARERLAERSNVRLIVGDSRERMPELTRPGDVAVLDGPKDFRGLKLAARVLRRSRPRLLFMHDCNRGSVEREVLDDLLPHAFYSDDPEFERTFAELDSVYRPWPGARADEVWRPHWFYGREQQSYGFTYACVPYSDAVSWWSVEARIRVRALAKQLARSTRKRLTRQS